MILSEPRKCSLKALHRKGFKSQELMIALFLDQLDTRLGSRKSVKG